MRKIKFKGKNYWLIGTKEEGGAIATPEQFSNFACSFAHLFPNGEVKRFNKVIGHVSDIEFGEEVSEKEDIESSSHGLVSFMENGFSRW